MSEQFYRSLYRIRRVEERIAEIYPTDNDITQSHTVRTDETLMDRRPLMRRGA